MNSFTMSELTPLFTSKHKATATAFTIAATYFVVKSLRKMFKCCKNDPSLPRRISFTSASMAMQPWPERVNMCDPIINAAIFMNDLPEDEELMKLVHFALTFERMSGVPTGTPGKNNWCFRHLDDIEPNKLVRRLSMSGNDEELVEFIGTHMQDSLRDSSSRNSAKELPWWEFLVIRNDGTGSSAIVLRIEHSLADGLSLVKLFEGFLTKESGEPVQDLVPVSMENKFEKQKKHKWAMYLKIIPSFFKALAMPTGKFDCDTVFSSSGNKNMIYSGTRKIVVFPTISLQFIKDIKNVHGVTVNDVLLTALSLAISKYNRLNNCKVTEKQGTKLQCRALMPVALPRADSNESSSLRNKWVFISADMGTGISSIKERLRHVHKVMNGIKNSPLAQVQLSVQETIPPSIPFNLARETVFDSFCRHSVVFSNVPGPTYPCLFAKKPALGCQMFFNNLIPQVGILSYNSQVFTNIILDPEAFPSCGKLSDLFKNALIEMANESNVEIPDNF